MNETSQLMIGHGLFIVFAAVLLDQLGLPLPAFPWLLAAGALVTTGQFNPLLGVAAVVLACLLSDSFWFCLGRQRGTRVLGFLCRISLEPDSCVRRTQNVFTRYGLRGVLIAKFLPGLGSVVPPLAGMSRISFSRFLIVDAAGSFLYGICFIGTGYFFSRQLKLIIAAITRIGSSAFGFMIGLAALYVLFKFCQRRRMLDEIRAARITVGELRQLLAAGQSPVIVDLRASVELDHDPSIIPGAVHSTMEEIEHFAQTTPHDREIILYCSCPNEESSARAALLLQRKGFTRVRPLLGGIDAWREQNFPVETSLVSNGINGGTAAV